MLEETIKYPDESLKIKTQRFGISLIHSKKIHIFTKFQEDTKHGAYILVGETKLQQAQQHLTSARDK